MNPLRDFSAAELNDALARLEVVLVDVREPDEFQQAHIEGAISRPLSGFDPTDLPRGDIVLQCAGGKRSRKAAELCEKTGMKIAGHLAGGLTAWAGAGLPLVSG